MGAYLVISFTVQSDEYDECGHRVIEDDDGPMQMDTSPAGELERAERLLGCEFIEQVSSFAMPTWVRT
jgi:hypothetical protein